MDFPSVPHPDQLHAARPRRLVRVKSYDRLRLVTIPIIVTLEFMTHQFLHTHLCSSFEASPHHPDFVTVSSPRLSYTEW